MVEGGDRTMNTIEYYIREREIAFDPLSPAHILPRFRRSDKIVLDIGGGTGYIFDASIQAGRLEKPEKLYVVDINTMALEYGAKQYPDIIFIPSSAERLPFCDNKFDCVISRVTLPLTNIPVVLQEIHRTLKPGGHVWLTMHSWDRVWFDIKQAWRQRDYKKLIVRSYVALNGVYFNLTGHLFRLGNRMESWQSERGMYKALLKAGFVDPIALNTDFFVCEARKAK